MFDKILAYYSNPLPTTLLLVGAVAAVGAYRARDGARRSFGGPRGEVFGQDAWGARVR